MFDLMASAEHSQGPANCGFAQTFSARRVALNLLTSPERSADGGTLRALMVGAPTGAIFRAQESHDYSVLYSYFPVDEGAMNATRAAMQTSVTT